MYPYPTVTDFKLGLWLGSVRKIILYRVYSNKHRRRALEDPEQIILLSCIIG